MRRASSVERGRRDADKPTAEGEPEGRSVGGAGARARRRKARPRIRCGAGGGGEWMGKMLGNGGSFSVLSKEPGSHHRVANGATYAYQYGPVSARCRGCWWTCEECGRDVADERRRISILLVAALPAGKSTLQSIPNPWLFCQVACTASFWTLDVLAFY